MQDKEESNGGRREEGEKKVERGKRGRDGRGWSGGMRRENKGRERHLVSFFGFYSYFFSF